MEEKGENIATGGNDTQTTIDLAITELYTNACLFIMRRMFQSRRNFMRLIIERRAKLHKHLLHSCYNKKRRGKKKRYDGWWRNLVDNSYPDCEMLQHFHFNRETFLYILEKVREDLEPSPLAFTPCLSVTKIVGIAIFKLASCAKYRVVGALFGVHTCTVKKCLHRFCKSLIKNCFHTEIRLPQTIEDVARVSEQFETLCKIGPVVGAIDGTHIPITPPQDGYRDFVNRKGWPSMIWQVVVDASLLFRNICIKHPGSCHDAKVFKDSGLYSTFEDIIPKHTRTVDNIEVYPVLIGDPAYPLLPWLIKGFSGAKTMQEESFNAYLSSGRVVAETAIGRLKSRWRILSKRMDVNYKLVPEITAACCILHNIAERRKVNLLPSWIEETQIFLDKYPQPARSATNAFHTTGTTIRKHLKNHIDNSQPLRRGNAL